MTLQNHQYEEIMRVYSRRQIEGERIARERREEVAAHLPRLRQIDAEAAALGAGQMRAVLNGGPADLSTLNKKLALLSAERKSLLVSHGYPENYLEIPYICPSCQDTGYIGHEKCSCLKKAELSVLYSQSNLQNVLEKENFSSFSFDFYSDTLIHESTGQSALDLAHKAYETARHFVATFDDCFQNLFLYGNTGVGKTFLSHCIAKELLSTAHLVLYFSSHDLFERLADFAFSGQSLSGSLEDILESDLLIIDDLGTELTNSFVSSQLFLCVNERLLRQKSTLISTNLKLEDFSSVYSERTFSRIAGNYQMIKLIGQDIRVQQLFQ